jgi:predicted enzyme related to lactoylglutathione lyase
MGNPFVYVQLQTQDLGKAKAFYQQLFDWKFDEKQTPAGPYAEVRVGEGTAGGMVGLRDATTPSRWIPYVIVTDIKSTTDKARALGATVLQGPIQLPDKSWFSVIVDTTGATFALHQGAAG